MIGASGKNARGYVEGKYGYLAGGQMYITLCSLGSLLDAKLLQMTGAPKDVIERDPGVEIICSEIVANDFYATTPQRGRNFCEFYIVKSL